MTIERMLELLLMYSFLDKHSPRTEIEECNFEESAFKKRLDKLEEEFINQYES